jgi:hypothetical protein
MHDCASGLIHVRKTTHELITDSDCRKTNRSWKSTTIIVTVHDIYFSYDRRREAKIGNDAIHDLKGSVT